MVHKGLVSTVVVNWNGKSVIADCLESLIVQTYQSHEIIVVDNGSTDGSLEAVQERYWSRIVLVENGTNLGFAEGVNVGIKSAKGEFIALLNSDACADKNWIAEMENGMNRSDRFGMIACKIYREGGRNLLDNTGEVMTRDGLGRGRGRLEKDLGQFDSSASVLCPSGCAALYRRKMLDEIGLFDAHFFLYAEDIDAGLRGRLAGYDCVYVPAAVVEHKFSASSSPVSDLKAYYVERNRLWIVIKCFPLSDLLLSFFYTKLRYVYHALGILKGKGPAARYAEKSSAFKLLFLLMKAYASTCFHLPRLISERKRVRRQSVVTAREFRSWLRSYGMSVREAALKEL
jgi:GT2 family glycosyltransferase